MGTVYLGRSPGGRAVAVKVVHGRFARDPRYRARFRREVAAARTVTGTFTAPLLDAAPEADVPWLATDHLPGLSLREAVGTFGGLPPAAVRLLAAALAEALADIHRAGLAHRDLKPGNIILTAGGPRVIDFGIARPDDATAITVPGALLGTPSFMAPEQASGRLAGPPADIFALGSVLAFAATGREPFGTGDRAATLERVRQARPDLAGLTDRALRAFVADCLRQDPDDRPRAAALLDRLGEPAASVRGTRWLPAPLAEAIDRRVAAPWPAPTAATPAPPAVTGGGAATGTGVDVLPDGTTADPSAVAVTGTGAVAGTGADALPDETTADPSAVTGGFPPLPGVPAPPGHPPPRRGPRRRGLLAAAVALPVAAGAAVVVRQVTVSGGPARPRPSHASSRPSPSPPSAGPTAPARATRLWRTHAMKDPNGSPDLYGTGSVVLAVGGTDAQIRALDAGTGRVLWSRRGDLGTPDKVVVADGTVCLFAPRIGEKNQDSSVLRALRPGSGTTRWTWRLPLGAFPSEAAATGSLICVADGNQVTGLGARDGRQRWTIRAKAGALSLAARDGLVVAAGNQALTALDAARGRVRWTRHLPKSPLSSVISDGFVVARDTVGTVYAVHAHDGKPAWTKDVDYRADLRHAGGGLLFVAGPDPTVQALRAATGKPVWTRRLDEDGAGFGAAGTLGISGGTLWAVGPGPRVHALDVADGRVLWTYDAEATTGTDSHIGAGALAMGGRVLLGTSGGYVEAVHPPARQSGGSRGTA
jgi:outer membrane protein assembly factor BamB